MFICFQRSNWLEGEMCFAGYLNCIHVLFNVSLREYHKWTLHSPDRIVYKLPEEIRQNIPCTHLLAHTLYPVHTILSPFFILQSHSNRTYTTASY